MGCYSYLFLALAEGLGAVWALLGAFGPLLSSSIQKNTLRWSFRYLEHQNLSSNSWDNCLVPFLATREAVAPLANDPIMSGTSIRSFRHLKHQNLSTGGDFIHSSGKIFLVLFLVTREAVLPIASDPIMLGRLIQSFRHLECQNLSIISYSIGRARMLQKFQRRRRRRRNRVQLS